MLQETFNWKSLSIIGGLVLLRFYFQIHAGSIKGPQVVEFLQHLQRHVPGKLLILWDGASIHRSALVRDYLVSTDGRVEVERLPAYAPELNPVEYMWGHLKTHEIANLVASPSVWNLTFGLLRRFGGCAGVPQLSPPVTPKLLYGLEPTVLYEIQ